MSGVYTKNKGGASHVFAILDMLLYPGQFSHFSYLCLSGKAWIVPSAANTEQH